VTVTAFAYPGLLSSTPSGFSVSACGEKFVFIRVKDPAFFAKNLCAFVSWWFKSHQGVPTPSKVFQGFFQKKKIVYFLPRRSFAKAGLHWFRICLNPNQGGRVRFKPF
jgi:hypothetical protein